MADRIIRPAEAVKRYARSRTQIWRDVRAGKWPAPLELGPNAIGWWESVLDAAVAANGHRTYGAEKPYEAPVEASPAGMGERLSEQEDGSA